MYTSSSHDLADQDLWVCLICGFSGCGLSRQGHIYQHYQETLHTYAMNVFSRGVWDFAGKKIQFTKYTRVFKEEFFCYVGDGYVHRLILNISDEEINRAATLQPYTTTTAEQATNLPLKIVEVGDRNYHSPIRSTVQPLSSEREEFIVNKRLEDLAQHYNQVRL